MANSIAMNNNIVVVLVLLMCVEATILHVAYGNNGGRKRPVLFIFGDSTADVGTNNFLPTKAKANMPYNGIDFAQSKSTGRFSNGFNTIDYIARKFGYKKSPPPFLALEKHQDTFKKAILRGANFASGGSGILQQTGINQGTVISLEEQVAQFAVVRGNISEELGEKDAETFVSKALFIISVGGNDIIDFSPNHTSNDGGLQQYLGLLQFNYYAQLRNLHALGGRKFGIIGVPPVGCCPAIRALNYSVYKGDCVKEANQFADLLYAATDGLLQRLSSELNHFNYSLGNSIAMTSSVIANPHPFGFKDTKNACCGDGVLNGEAPCVKANNAKLCGKRGDYLFWDWFHPSSKASELAANILYASNSQFVTPINFSQLALI